MDDLEELWITIIGAIFILSAGTFLILKIRNWSAPALPEFTTPDFKFPPVSSKYLSSNMRIILCGVFIVSIAFAAIFTGNNLIGYGPASSDTIASAPGGTPPELVDVEFKSSLVLGTESSTMPLKIRITNNGDTILRDVRFEGQSEGIVIPPGNASLLTVSFGIKSFTSHRNMNATLFYTSNGITSSKQVETPIYPIPNAAISNLEYKRDTQNLFFPDQFEPGNNVTLKVTVINKGISKLPGGSIKILGFTEDLEVAANTSESVNVSLNKNGEYSYEVTLRISENPPYGETAINIALMYNDTQKGELTTDQRSIPIKVVTRSYNRLF